MREVKFRGKSTTLKGWVYGNLIHITEIDLGVEDFEPCDIYQIIEPNGVAWNVDKETIGQYTGLKDKNGVEIYEGDILDFDHEEEGHIEYCEGDAMFVLIVGNITYDFSHIDSRWAMVMGNIHDVNLEENVDPMEDLDVEERLKGR